MKAPSPHDVRERYTERLWQVAHCFHPEGSQEASDSVEQRRSRILDGDVGRVIGGFKQRATSRGFEVAVGPSFARPSRTSEQP